MTHPAGVRPPPPSSRSDLSVTTGHCRRLSRDQVQGGQVVSAAKGTASIPTSDETGWLFGSCPYTVLHFDWNLGAVVYGMSFPHSAEFKPLGRRPGSCSVHRCGTGQGGGRRASLAALSKAAKCWSVRAAVGSALSTALGRTPRPLAGLWPSLSSALPSCLAPRHRGRQGLRPSRP